MGLLPKNRAFSKQPPTLEAKKIYIFCEGAKREKQYFEYFQNIDSRLNVIVYHLDETEDNSPKGLFEIACRCLISSIENLKPTYEYLEEDEVWLVFDTDPDQANSREPQIEFLRNECSSKNWKIALSNPCFEVWLNFHFNTSEIDVTDKSICENWKIYVQKSYGGFNSGKHPVYIQTAILNAKAQYKADNNQLNAGNTEVFMLAEAILDIGDTKIIINDALSRMSI